MITLKGPSGKTATNFKPRTVRRLFINIILKIAIFLLLSTANIAQAYIGPGLGAGTLGVILDLLGSVILALFAFFWYPIKRTLFSNKSEDKDGLEAIKENTAAGKTK